MIFIDPKKPRKLFKSAESRTRFALLFTLLFAPALSYGQQFSLTANATDSQINFDWSRLSNQPPAKIISTLKEELGAYDSRLPNTLRLIGRQYQEADAHSEALTLLKDAWQLSRINDGFYSDAQIPTLELIIFSEMEMGNWEAVDDHYAYLELLHRRVFDESDPRLELGLQKVSAWHVNALSLRAGKTERIHHLRSAYHLFKDRLAMAEANLDSSDPKFGYLRESIKLTEQQLRLNSEMNKAIILQQQRVGSGSLLADSY